MKPLGLPEGSVRSILAVGALASAVFMWVTGQPMPEEQKTLVAVAMTYYFASRPGETPTPPAVNLEDVDLLKRVRAMMEAQSGS